MKLTTHRKALLLPVLMPLARGLYAAASAFRWVMRPDLRGK